MTPFKTTIERSVNGCDCEVDIAVQYTACPAVRGSFESGGLQMEPDEPAHIDIECATEDETGVEIELTTAQTLDIERQIAEVLTDEDNFAREEHADRLRDERAERGA